MALLLQEITVLARTLVQEHYGDRVTVDGVAGANGGATVDVLLTLRAAPASTRPNRTALVQIRNTDAPAVARDLAAALSRMVSD